MAKNRLFFPGRALGLLLSSFLITLPEHAQQPAKDNSQAYVTGNVLRPTAVPLKESITLTQAISAAGGTQNAKDDKVDIVRLFAKDGTETGHTCVSLREVKKGRTADLQLQDNDILEVVRGKCARPMCWEILFNLDQRPIRIIR